MDPSVCLHRMRRAAIADDLVDFIAAQSDLLCWLLAGGFVPETDIREREHIRRLCAHMADFAEDKT